MPTQTRVTLQSKKTLLTALFELSLNISKALQLVFPSAQKIPAKLYFFDTKAIARNFSNALKELLTDFHAQRVYFGMQLVKAAACPGISY